MTGEGKRDRRVVVIGTGPPGLTAAYELARFNLRPVVLEKFRTVGGVALFDLGGHRVYM